MAHCRCKTINLALVSVEKLKEMECRIQKVQPKKYEKRLCPKQEEMPAPPGPVSKRKIMVCPVRPIEFQAPPVPCVCPPCPPCPTYGERSMELLKNGLKLFILYVAVKWTMDNKIWGDHKGTSDFMLGFMESNFTTNGTPKLPDMQLLRYKILHGWDTVVGNFFYYTFGLPLKIIAKIQGAMTTEEDEIHHDLYCPKACSTK